MVLPNGRTAEPPSPIEVDLGGVFRRTRCEYLLCQVAAESPSKTQPLLGRFKRNKGEPVLMEWTQPHYLKRPLKGPGW